VPSARVPANIALKTDRLQILQQRPVVGDIDDVRIIRPAANSACRYSSGIVVFDEIIDSELNIATLIEAKIIDPSCTHIVDNVVKAVPNATLDKHPVVLKLHRIIAFRHADGLPVAIMQAVCPDCFVTNAGKPLRNRIQPVIVVFTMRLRVDKDPYDKFGAWRAAAEAV
jgi:hypothetical protein